MIMMIVQERICVFIRELLNSNFVKFLDHARKCRIQISFFDRETGCTFFADMSRKAPYQMHAI